MSMRPLGRRAGVTVLLLLMPLSAMSAPADRELPAPDRDALPSQETYRGWPPEALLERPYWNPWSIGAFARAATFGRPVLFVMAVRWNQTSRRMMDGTLSDPRVLRAINESYVPVLVNPDRRPELRERYQTGALPVIAMLLPSGNPILSRANEARQQLPITIGPVGVEPMLFLLGEGDEYYKKWTRPLTDTGRAWAEREVPDPPRSGPVAAPASDALASYLMANADRSEGGFGLAPKFLVPGLLEYGALRAARGLRDVAGHGRFTLERLLASPLYDSREGGMHRVSGAPDWQAIEYEKMLVPNTQLLRELLVAANLGDDDGSLRGAIEATASFIRETLASGDGGLFIGQWSDPASEDGGGYWRGEHDEAPPVEPLVLAGSTAMAGATLLRVGWWLDDEGLRREALGALEYVRERAYVRGRGVIHVIDPHPNPALRLLWPQAETAFAFVEAYQWTGERRWLDTATDIVDFALANLRVADSSLLVDHLPSVQGTGLLRNPRFPMRPNMLLARTLLRLWRLTGEQRYFDEGLSLVGAIAGDLTVYRPWPADAGLALEEAISEPVHVTIEGARGSAPVVEFVRAAARLPHPWVVVGYRDAERAGAALARGRRSARAPLPELLGSRVEQLTAEQEPGGSGP